MLFCYGLWNIHVMDICIHDCLHGDEDWTARLLESISVLRLTMRWFNHDTPRIRPFDHPVAQMIFQSP